MRGQRGWRELAVLGDKMNKFRGVIERFIWSPRSSDGKDQCDDGWDFEEVGVAFETYSSFNFQHHSFNGKYLVCSCLPFGSLSEEIVQGTGLDGLCLSLTRP